jgi:hypothetical protein
MFELEKLELVKLQNEILENSEKQRLVFAFFGSEPIDEIVCYHFA